MKPNLTIQRNKVCLILLLLSGFRSFAQDPFITVWKTDNVGGFTNNNQVLLRATGSYNYVWENVNNTSVNGSGTDAGNINLPLTITFPAAGTYRIKMTPTGTNPFNRLDFNSSSSDAPKLTGVEQWGDAVWSSMEYAFSNANNLTSITATDTPNLSNVTSMRDMFSYATSLTAVAGINNWDVSHVTNMQSTFEEANHFNSALSNWSTGSVTTMQQMFSGAFTFNQDIGPWNVGNVRNTYSMFNVASAFDQNIGNWNLSNDTIMAYMFASALNFNQDISSWNVANVKRMDFMFQAARAFDQAIGSWNVSSVTDMNSMFMNANSFNQPLNQWNVAAVNNMQNMFQAAYPFDQQLGSWNLSSVMNVTNMFNFTSLSCANYSNTLIGWAANASTPNGLSLTNNLLESGDPINYNTDAQSARNTLINTKNWTITGDNYDATCISTPVPIKWISFEAHKQNNEVQLKWITTSEQNNKGFQIQKSIDAVNWQPIAFLNSKFTANNNFETVYSYTDKFPFTTSNYYRLKQIDLNGQYTYSEIIMLDFTSNPNAIKTYPNPVKNNFNIFAKGLKEITITNQLGQTILNTIVEDNIASTYFINCSNWPKGIYLLKTIAISGNINIEKIVKD